jgi:hypothetical protein
MRTWLAKWGRRSLSFGVLFVAGILCFVGAVVLARSSRPHDRAEPAASEPATNAPEQQQQARAEEAVPDIVRQADALVEGIYRFRSRTGLWPMSLSELDDLPLSPRQLGNINYEWDQNGYWEMQCWQSHPDFTGWFGHTPLDGGNWRTALGKRDPELSRFPHLDDPVIDPVCLAPATEKVLRQRIAAEPHRPMHHQGLVLLLYRLNKRTEALVACRASYKQCPDHWWNQLMLAKLEHELHVEREAGTDQRLLAWARSHNDLTHFVLVAQHHLESGNREEAFRLLRHAITLPVRHLYPPPSTGEVHGFAAFAFLRQAAYMAYREQQYDLLLAICDRWEGEKEKGECSYLAFRAAGLLAQEKYEEAAKTCKFAQEQYRSQPWARNLVPLQQAVRDKNAAFKYDPGDFPSSMMMSLFMHYE